MRGHDITGYSTNPYGMDYLILFSGNYLCSSLPCVADGVIEEIRRVCHKYIVSHHVVVCPKVMTYKWLGQLFKSADFVFDIKSGTRSYWTADRHKTLIIALIFQFLSHSPWQVRNISYIFQMGGKVWSLLQASEATEGNILRELCTQTNELETMSESVVWKVLCGVPRV